MRASEGWSVMLWTLVWTASGADTFAGYDYYLGDPHAHTGYSGDAGSLDLGNCNGTCGNFADVFATARANGLDWVALSDHVNGSSALSSEDFVALHAAVLAAHAPSDGFVTLPAAEVWFVSPDGDLGHKTLLLFGQQDELGVVERTYMQPTQSTGTAVSSCDAIWEWMAELQHVAGPALLVPHHPALLQPMSTDWTCHNDEWQPVAEVHSEHGNSLTADTTYDPPWSGVVAEGTIHHAMDPEGLGLRMGFIGGTDSHDTMPGGVCDIDTERWQHPYGGGLTVTMLAEGETFDRPTIYGAMTDRRTYATTGPLVPVSIRWMSAGAELGEIGDDLGLPDGQSLTAALRVASEWEPYVLGVQVIGPWGSWTAEAGAHSTWSATIDAAEVPPWAYVAVELDGDRWYTDGCDDGGSSSSEWLWLSPSWVFSSDGDLDADGWTWADGDCDDGDATIHPAAGERWYDGVDQDCDGNDDDQDEDGAPQRVDCDDEDPARSPDFQEVWYDGVDQDCDGNDDDQDGDGSAVTEDCDDLDVGVGTDVEEVWYDGVDQDCDGNDDDQDEDGSGFLDDCDDLDPGVSPLLAEIWYDGIDQDCDGNDDDQDGDGVAYAEDCDDQDRAAKPGSGGWSDDCIRTRTPPGCGLGIGAEWAWVLGASLVRVRRRR